MVNTLYIPIQSVKAMGNPLMNHLIVFTRYPIPGTTKTRLIPALGAEGAADLQRQLTEQTLEQVTSLAIAVDVSVYFSGGNMAQMQAWLSTQWRYQIQRGENLGDRLINAFQNSHKQGYQHTVIIGIDCPGLTHKILQEAFTALHHHDLVLGQAYDGGYYLIGLQQPRPELFTAITWGTASVLPETLQRAANLGLSTQLLPLLHDIDYPEDLKFFQGSTTIGKPPEYRSNEINHP